MLDKLIDKLPDFIYYRLGKLSAMQSYILGMVIGLVVFACIILML